ncbi:MAG TPA: TRAM domain-containing protein [Jatrophihabitans sp.]|nr:TRAM domain-containing protein [Jatrophihabitans sp.]
MAASVDWTGRQLLLDVGAVAHGGHCVARFEGRVVFVRHALPGERVLALVTEDRGGSFCRADAVQVLQPAVDRVEPPCEHARPGGCGGCDFQHVSGPGQRALKAAVVSEQLRRLAGIERTVEVQPLSAALLGWRRRIRFAVDREGYLGLHKHRSHELVRLQHCPLGAAGVGDAEALAEPWPGLAEVELAVDDHGRVAAVGYPPAARPRPDRGRRSRPVQRPRQLFGPETLRYEVAGRSFELRPAGFWQTHPQAAETFTEAVLLGAALRPGERALDLYAGAGLFTAALAEAVGVTGSVLGLEGDRSAVEAAAGNLAGLPWAGVRREAVTAGSVARAGRPDVVVLDPPRTGAGLEVMSALLQLGARTVVYVACDPAALARDLKPALDRQWRLAELTAYDAYPMTHHVECVAVLAAPD